MDTFYVNSAKLWYHMAGFWRLLNDKRQAMEALNAMHSAIAKCREATNG